MKKKTLAEFTSEATEKHNGFYSYGNFVYVNNNTESYITCPRHGDFKQGPNEHKQGHGCRECAREKFGKTRYEKAKNEFVEKATKQHNVFYTYGNFIYLGDRVSGYITCPVHGDFLQSPGDHKQGNGCSRCKNTGYSRMAVKWIEDISQQEGIFIAHALNVGEYKIPGTRYHADGYCEETKTVYEFHGDAFHGNPGLYNEDDTPNYFSKHLTAKELHEKTKKKEQKIKALGYNLVTIWESEYKNQAIQQFI
jgi:hypothetical protein